MLCINHAMEEKSRCLFILIYIHILRNDLYFKICFLKIFIFFIHNIKNYLNSQNLYMKLELKWIEKYHRGFCPILVLFFHN